MRQLLFFPPSLVFGSLPGAEPLCFEAGAKLLLSIRDTGVLAPSELPRAPSYITISNRLRDHNATFTEASPWKFALKCPSFGPFWPPAST